MTKLPAITGNQVIKALHKAGLIVLSQKGSHVKLKHPDGRITIIPIHKGEVIGKGLFMKILHDIDMTKEEFLPLI